MPYPDFPLFGLWYICLAMAGCLGVVRRDGVAPLSYRFFDCCCDFSILPRILIKGMMVACRSVFFTLVPWQASIVTFALCKCRADPDLLSDYVASFRERQMLPSGAAIVDHLCVQRGFHDIQSWHSSRKGRLPIHGLSGNGTDHEGNSSRPGKIRWMFGIEGILEFQRIREFEVPFKKLPCIIMHDSHGSWHHTAGVQMPCVPGCFFPRSC